MLIFGAMSIGIASEPGSVTPASVTAVKVTALSARVANGVARSVTSLYPLATVTGMDDGPVPPTDTSIEPLMAVGSVLMPNVILRVCRAAIAGKAHVIVRRPLGPQDGAEAALLTKAELDRRSPAAKVGLSRANPGGTATTINWPEADGPPPEFSSSTVRTPEPPASSPELTVDPAVTSSKGAGAVTELVVEPVVLVEPVVAEVVLLGVVGGELEVAGVDPVAEMVVAGLAVVAADEPVAEAVGPSGGITVCVDGEFGESVPGEPLTVELFADDGTTGTPFCGFPLDAVPVGAAAVDEVPVDGVTGLARTAVFGGV